jgi:hypothetical protein
MTAAAQEGELIVAKPAKPKVKRKTGVELAAERSITPEAQMRRAELCRLRIDSNKLIDRLQRHAMGRQGMTPTEVQAAQALLRKTVPDLPTNRAEVDASPIVFNFRISASKERA